MPEQRLDDADVDAVLEQVGRKAVTQRVRPDTLGDIRGLPDPLAILRPLLTTAVVRCSHDQRRESPKVGRSPHASA